MDICFIDEAFPILNGAFTACKNGANCTRQDTVQAFPLQIPDVSSGTLITLSISDFTCECAPGWKGVTCEEPELPCDSNPCLFNGNCTDTPNLIDFSCECPDYYFLKNCGALDICFIDEAFPILNGAFTACKNGASCTRQDTVQAFPLQIPDVSTGTLLTLSISDFSCECAPGWKGVTCEEQDLPCDSTPCLFNGNCTDTADLVDFSCECPDHYFLKNCGALDICYIDEAFPILNGAFNACKNGANCTRQDTVQAFPLQIPDVSTGTLLTLSISDFTCECAPGWKGVTCEEPDLPCDSNPCLFNGNCTDTADLTDFSCECPEYYFLKNCGALDICFIDEAFPILNGAFNACKNGANCTRQDTVQAFPLQIPDVSTGTLLTLTISDFSCECAEGWTGVTCEEVV